MPYIGKSPSAVGVRNRFYFTASGGETSLSGSDDNGKTLVFSDASYVDVILNGGNLVSGTDYTATPSTNTISGLTALVANDVVEIIAYDVFSVSDTVSAASGGTFQSNVNFDSGIDVTGNVTVTGTVDGRDVATDGTKLDGIEAGATADQTGAEIKASYEAEANTNAYTDAEKTKLTGIEALADVTDDTNVRAAGAVMTTGVSTLADNAYFKGAPTHGFRFNNNSDAYNNFIIRENGDTYTRGNAGIGTTSPSTRLHTQGGRVRFDANSENFALQLNNSTTGNGPFLGSAGADTFVVSASSGAERMRITSGGQIYTSAIPPQSIAPLTGRKSGAAIEFGHANNGGGYYGTLGSYGSAGIPYVGFSADAEDSVNTFTTRGFKGNLIVGNADGSLSFSQLTNASATGQTPVTRMAIDSSGRVTMPYQPAFHAYGTTAAWTVFSNGGWTTLVLAATAFNTGNHYNTSSSAFTAPVTGVYHLYYKVYGRVQSGGGTSTYWQSRFFKNNAGIAGADTMLMGYQYNTGGSDETATYSLNISLAANDQITLHAQSAGSYNGEYYPVYCEFGGYLIG